MSGQTKGWCPGALKPMRTGDGLLVRVRLTGGMLAPMLATALAQAARDFGNGLFDLTARANLQLRGVRDETLQPLLDRLSELGVLDESAEAEQVRNVLASPLAGLDATALIDVGSLVEELERRLTSDAAFHALPAKFGFLVDGGGVLALDGVEADIGLRAVSAEAFRLTVAEAELGLVAREAAVEAALGVAQAFLRLRRPDERRMRDLVKRLQDEARETALPSRERRRGLDLSTRGAWSVGLRPTCRLEIDTPQHLSLSRRTPDPHPTPSHLAGYYAACFAAAAPFGRLDVTQFEGLAAIAQTHSLALRLTPWRAILLAPVKVEDAPQIARDIAGLGLVTDPSDPRLAISACPGSPSCLSGEAPAQVDAARLAPVLASFIREGASVHVSGCAKGCARRAPASLMLVGQDGRYGLAFDADSKARSAIPLMDVDEIAAFLTKNTAEKSFKSSDHV